MYPRPPIGICVLSVVFVFIAFTSGAAFFVVPSSLKLSVGVLVPICVLFSLGVALRINAARLVLIQVLSFGLFTEAVLIFNSMRADVPRRLPVFPTATLIVLTVWTLAYLLRRDVRVAFGAVEPLAGGSGIDGAEGPEKLDEVGIPSTHNERVG